MQAMDHSFEFFSSYTAPHGLSFLAEQVGALYFASTLDFSRKYPKGYSHVPNYFLTMEALTYITSSLRRTSRTVWIDQPFIASRPNALAVGTVAPTCRGQGVYFEPRRLVIIGLPTLYTNRVHPILSVTAAMIVLFFAPFQQAKMQIS